MVVLRVAATPSGGWEAARAVSIYLECVQNSINRLQVANFILHFVKKPRRTFQVCLCFLPRSAQNLLTFAQSWKFEHTLKKYMEIRGGVLADSSHAWME